MVKARPYILMTCAYTIIICVAVALGCGFALIWTDAYVTIAKTFGTALMTGLTALFVGYTVDEYFY